MLLSTTNSIERLSVLFGFMLLIILTSAEILCAQTEVAGEVSGVWDIEGSPYIAVDEVSVPTGEQLTIEPGVEVRFQAQLPFLVNGILRAIGTEEDSVWFISDDPDNDVRWGGIHFVEAEDGCEIAFSHISGIGWEDAPRDINGILIERSSTVIRNCLITDCFDFHFDNRLARACLWIAEANGVIIEENSIVGNTGSAIGLFRGRGITRITGNIIRGNNGNGISCFQGDIAYIQSNQILDNSLHGLKIQNDFSNVENNTISGNEYDGISSRCNVVVIKGNVITNNSIRDGFGLDLHTHFGRSIVVGNIIAYNSSDGGVALDRGHKTHFYNNVVYRNSRYGIYGRQFANDKNIQNCILWGHFIDDISNGIHNIHYCAVGSRFGEEGMVNEVPRFIDPENGDFRLVEDSPLFDAGNPHPLYNDADGSRADLGAYGGNNLVFGFGESIEYSEIGYYCLNEEYITLCNFNENAVILREIILTGDENFTFDLEVPLQIPTHEWFNLPVTFRPMEAGEYNATLSLIFDDYNPVDRVETSLNATALDGAFGDASGVWTREMSPIHVIGDVIIPSWDTLYIDPGVELLLDPEVRIYNLDNRGRLFAIGTPEDSIIFTLALEEPEPGDWSAIRVKGEMAYCIAEYGVGITLSHDSRIDNSTIRNFYGISIEESGILSNSTITNCGTAISRSSRGYAYHNLIAFNETVNVGEEIWEEMADILTCEGNIFYQNEVINTLNRPHPAFRNNCIFASEVAGSPLIGGLNHENGNGIACDENFNIALNPQFVNTEESDFHLLEDSPCIDAGNPYWQRDTDGSWVDMGPFPFNNDDELPQIIIEPDLIEVEEPSENVINLTNDGEGRLWWRIFLDAEWASCEPMNGVLSQEEDLDLILTIEDMEFEPGIYETQLNVDSNDPENPMYSIPISMRIGGENIRALDVSFSEGWSLISVNINPLNCYLEGEARGPHIIRMFETVIDDIIMVKDERGGFYAPEFEFNNIPYWNLAEGYLVKTSSNIETSWSGEIILSYADVPLEEGWNFVAYFPTFELDASAPDFLVLSPIIDNVIIAKDENGLFLSPEFNFSNMPSWRESKGYQVRVNEDVVLNYPEGREGDIVVRGEAVKQDQRLPHFARNYSTSENMSVLIVSVSGIEVELGDRIAAFDLDGNLVGTGNTDADGRCGIAVWGNDKTTDMKEGLRTDEAFELRVWSSKSNIESLLSIESVYNGQLPLYEPNGFSAISVQSAPLLPNEFSLATAFPNPFNGTTKLSFNVPHTSQILIIISDIAGRHVKTLINSEKEAGSHTITWNAESYPTGVYIVKMEALGFKATGKLLLVK
ncbi:MAG: T9SS type A sorting domain-containing protein [Calditrichaeota bacterium]|nr:T9SS type A sorting domain-containing protein [Calditrichota bacterium]